MSSVPVAWTIARCAECSVCCTQSISWNARYLEPHADHFALDPWRQAQFVPLDFGSHMFLELDYLAGPSGLGVLGVIGECPTVLMEWSRSLQWCAFHYVWGCRL